MYGVTTGFGALCTQAIGKEDTEQLQENIILTHAVSVGEALKEEGVRGILLMILQNLGQGYSGVRLEVLEACRDFLNKGIVPVVPQSGSVGYLALEGHVALVRRGFGIRGGITVGRGAGSRPFAQKEKSLTWRWTGRTSYG